MQLILQVQCKNTVNALKVILFTVRLISSYVICTWRLSIMASELKVDKFTGVTTAGSILVTGEGNSTTTNLQQGLAKAWVQLIWVITINRDSFNVSSLSD